MLLRFRQFSKQNPKKDQNAANDGFHGKGLMKKNNSQGSGYHRIQGAEHSGPLGCGPALCHWLQGKPEAAAYGSKHHDPKPFHGAAR